MEIITESFQKSIKDYLFLINKGYPVRKTLKLVGDRHRLSGTQRSILFRGVTSREKSIKRKLKIIDKIKDQPLHVDGYNVLFTITNYMLGKILFLGNDELLRDSGGGYGKVENDSFFSTAADMVFDYTTTHHVRALRIYLDHPVLNSTVHKEIIDGKIKKRKINGSVLMMKSVDNELKGIKEGILSTSDSEIIDCTPCQIIDLARKSLEAKYKIKVLNLSNLI